jgi:magnesium-dependent phosphatase 1
MTSKIPKMFVFDLDGCVWEPEMYEIWGGGSPFKTQKNGNVKDCKGQEVYFLGDVRKILYELHTDSKYADSIVGVASTCDGKEK